MRTKIFIAAILVLALFLRLWKLGSIPPHLTADEASLGYNAYSILKTGKDEYGEFLPLIFKSFGDYKPGLYIYLTVPFVAVLGLNEFSVRVVSAISGVVSVIFLYLIIEKIFNNKKLSIISSFLLAINPWHIHFSRGAWEVNLSLFFTLCGIYLFLKAIEQTKNKYYLLLSAFSFALTFLTYQGAKLSTLIVVLILFVVYRKEIVKINRKTIFYSVVLGVLISLPIVFSLFQGKTGRLNVFSVFSYPRGEEYLQNFLDEAGVKRGSLIYYLFYSEPLNFTRGIMGRWFNHFSARFLFFEGDWQNPRHSAPNHGMLLLADLIFIIVGLFVFLKDRIKKQHLFFLLWLILSPLPAILSRDQVHAVRAFNMLVPLVVIAGFGLWFVFTNYKKFRFIIFGLYFLSILYYLDAYFVHLERHNSKLWEYGYKQVVETISPIQNSYQCIKVQQSYAQPYIYFLFYQNYPPQKYQAQARLVESEVGDVGQVEKLDNIYFSPIDWSVNRGEKGTLFIADSIRIPPEDSKDQDLFKLIKEIKYLDGQSAFRILEVKNEQ